MTFPSLDADQLDAFEAVARLGSFSAAAQELHVTQPALSRRIQGLERELELSLFTRGRGGVELTTEGERLIEYVRTRKALEEELRFDLSGGKRGALGGTVRVAGYSTLLQEVAVPALAPLLRKNPEAQLHLVATQGVRPHTREISLVQRSEVDFLFSSLPPPDKTDIIGRRVGAHELVVIESTTYSGREDTLLDTRPEDTATEVFAASQKKTFPPYRRSFLHDETGLLQGVLLGLGRSVIIRSLIPHNARVRIVEEWRPLRWPIYLIYRRQRQVPRLVQEAKRLLFLGCEEHLR